MNTIASKLRSTVVLPLLLVCLAAAPACKPASAATTIKRSPAGASGGGTSNLTLGWMDSEIAAAKAYDSTYNMFWSPPSGSPILNGTTASSPFEGAGTPLERSVTGSATARVSQTVTGGAWVIDSGVSSGSAAFVFTGSQPALIASQLNSSYYVSVLATFTGPLANAGTAFLVARIGQPGNISNGASVGVGYRFNTDATHYAIQQFDGSVANDIAASSGPTPDTGTAHRVGFRYNGGAGTPTLEMFVDGAVIATTTSTTRMANQPGCFNAVVVNGTATSEKVTISEIFVATKAMQ